MLILAGRIATRWIQRTLRSLGYNTRKFAIVGVNELGFQLARNIEASPEMGLSLAGFFDDRPEERNPDIPADLGHRVGTIQDLVEQAKAGAIDRIYITFPMRAEDRIRGVLDQLGDTTASVYIVPDFFVFQLLHSRWTDILGLPVVSVFESPLYGIDGLVKRRLRPRSGRPAAAAGRRADGGDRRVRSSSPRPARRCFRQRRYGLDGREIRIWKFRTMTVCEDGPQAVQATPDDPRVTRLGAFLRRTSLDELPQLVQRAWRAACRWSARVRTPTPRTRSSARRSTATCSGTRSSRASPAWPRSTAGAARPTRPRKCRNASNSTTATSASGRCGWTSRSF